MTLFLACLSTALFLSGLYVMVLWHVEHRDTAKLRARYVEAKVERDRLWSALQATTLDDDDPEMTVAEFQAAKCAHCGGAHTKTCGRVAELSFHTDGKTVIGVKYWATWDDTDVIYQEHLVDQPVEGEIVE